MISQTFKITQKGQVTLPKEIRKKLKANSIYYEIRGDDILVKPVRDLSGSLRKYAKNVKPGASMKDLKEKAWEIAVREKADKDIY